MTLKKKRLHKFSKTTPLTSGKAGVQTPIDLTPKPIGVKYYIILPKQYSRKSPRFELRDLPAKPSSTIILRVTLGKVF